MILASGNGNGGWPKLVRQEEGGNGTQYLSQKSCLIKRPLQRLPLCLKTKSAQNSLAGEEKAAMKPETCCNDLSPTIHNLYFRFLLLLDRDITSVFTLLTCQSWRPLPQRD